MFSEPYQNPFSKLLEQYVDVPVCFSPVLSFYFLNHVQGCSDLSCVAGEYSPGSPLIVVPGRPEDPNHFKTKDPPPLHFKCGWAKSCSRSAGIHPRYRPVAFFPSPIRHQPYHLRKDKAEKGSPERHNVQNRSSSGWRCWCRPFCCDALGEFGGGAKRFAALHLVPAGVARLARAAEGLHLKDGELWVFLGFS